MRNLLFNVVLIVVAIVIAAVSVVPPSEKLRLGKDLAGGINVVYQVDISADETARDVMGRVIEVVKDRLDPKGLLSINVVAQGDDRIEISMPLPSAESKALSKKFEEELAKLSIGAVAADDLDRLIAMDAAPREGEMQRLAAGDAAGLERLRKLVAAHDAMVAAQGPYEQQKQEVAAAKARLAEAEKDPNPPGGPDFVELLRQAVTAEEIKLDSLADASIAAEDAHDKARQDALGGAVSAAEVRRILRLSPDKIRVFDKDDKKLVELPSPREEAIARLKERHASAKTQLESVIAAWDAYEAKQTTLGDPSDVVRLLRGAGVLTFRITVDPNLLGDEAELRQTLQRSGPGAAASEQARWYKVNKIQNWYDNASDVEALRADPAAYLRAQGYVGEEYDGEYYILCWDKPGMRLTTQEGEWALASAGQGVDQIGRPAISFNMDRIGADRMGALTEKNVGNKMAVLLDDEIYTAPRINSRIAGSGIIEGDFSTAELQYIIRVLSAGSLHAKLSPEPISTSQVGPELGADNLRRGLQAGVLAFAVCAVFLIGYYFFCGVIAVGALVLNSLMLVGILALQDAPFSLPSIAGVILTFAMAVDANVLIYERMREEILKGADLKTAVRLGYQRALSAIVDGNLTNLIVCVVLISLGTQEIRGFGITMTIGVLTTLFSQLFVTRVVFEILLRYGGLRRIRMLPLVIPAVQRAFDLKVDWMRLRPLFAGVAATLVVLATVVCVTRGPRMFGNEFRGGTSVQILLARLPDEGDVRQTMKRADVEKAIRDYVDSSGNPNLQPLRDADIVVVNPQPDGVTSSTFTIKTVLTDQALVQDAVVAALGDKVESQQGLRFSGSEGDVARPPVYPLLSEDLAESLDQPDLNLKAPPEFVGGVAIVLRDMQPREATSRIRDRLEQFRVRPDYLSTLGRRTLVLPLAGTDASAASVAVLVRDPRFSYVDDPASWQAGLADVEWRLCRDALTSASALASVDSFSPSIAGTFVAKAVVSGVFSVLLVVIYVGVRFNSVRFSIASIVPTLLDCYIAVGLIGLSEVIFSSYPAVAQALGIGSFQIDLTMVAALLTILGYSINDKIVVLDRIRENRGKLRYVSRETINLSVNQTISRTLMTGTTTILSCVVLYLVGGPSVSGFAFALGMGVIIGTFSSIALGAPMVWSGPRAGQPSIGARAAGEPGHDGQPVRTVMPAPAPTSA
jgi:SecD/SecF fusion protein